MQDVNKLIELNKGLVYAQLKHFKFLHDPEAESIAYEALYKAILNYDSSKGTKLSTVATVYIYNALGSYLRSLNSTRQVETISYNNIAFTDDKEEHEFEDFIASSVDIERDYINAEMKALAMETFIKLYDKLTNEKHKMILDIWRSSEFIATTVQIAEQANVSQSYVSQVINNFKHSLRKKLEDIYYD